MQQPILLPHVTKLVDLILIEVFLLTKVLQEGDKYGVTCHVTYIELVHGHGHDLGGVSPQPKLPCLLLVPE